MKTITPIKSLILALVLMLASTSLIAEWSKVGENENRNQYIDMSTIRKSDNKAKVWVLNDFSQNAVKKNIENNPKKDLSQISRSNVFEMELNCYDQTYELTMVVFKSGQMGKGETLDTVILPPLERSIPIIPGSTDEETFKLILKEACKEKSGMDWLTSHF